MTDNTRGLDGNLLKTLVGGGDKIVIRRNYVDKVEVVNQSLMCLFLNDLPKITPLDAAIKERVEAIWFDCSFVPTPEAEYEKPMVAGVKARLCTPDMLDSFIHLLTDSFKDHRDSGFTAPDECRQFKEDLLPTRKAKDVLEEAYDITRNPDHWVKTSELIDHLRAEGFEGSDHRLGRELTDLGLVSGQRRTSAVSKNCKVRLGIRDKREAHSGF